jgi:hypothetical protein
MNKKKQPINEIFLDDFLKTIPEDSILYKNLKRLIIIYNNEKNLCETIRLIKDTKTGKISAYNVYFYVDSYANSPNEYRRYLFRYDSEGKYLSRNVMRYKGLLPKKDKSEENVK